MKTLLIIITAFLMIVFVNGTAQVTDQNAKSENRCVADVQLNSDNLIVVRYLNVDDRKISVFVYDQEGEKIDSRTFRTNGDMKVSYKLKNLPAGELVFKVMCNKKLVCAEKVTIAQNGKAEIPVPIIGLDKPENNGSNLVLEQQL